MLHHRRQCFWLNILTPALLSGFLPATSVAQEGEVSIADNSFLIEEAYNQEPGVVQHIFNWVPAWEHGRGGIGAQRTFDFVFTQEWPVFSQRHQISYTIPFSRYDDEIVGGGGAGAGGIGDILLNYRFQALNDEQGDIVAFAPRLTFSFPTGDADLGLGNGVVGYDLNFPVSKTFDRWAFHFNAGLTQTPGATAGVDPQLEFEGRTLQGFHVGGSAIYFLRPNFHLMLEQLNVWDDELQFEGHKDSQFLCYLSPGFRWAALTRGDTQWVLGLGLPVGLSEDTPDISVFFYMSFEHRFQPKREE